MRCCHQRARHAVQLFNCAHDRAVVGLNLSAIGLRGRLPAGLNRLALTYLDVSHNPHLRGRIPPDLATQSLVAMKIRNTSLACHDDKMSASEIVAFSKVRHLRISRDALQLHTCSQTDLCTHAQSTGLLRCS
jgi:hypothetical protein